MDLTKHYDWLYADAIQKIKAGRYEADPMIDSPDDDRRGLTLLIRPSVQVSQKIMTFINELKTIDPNQYYYPQRDMHVTGLSVISCYAGFRLPMVNVNDYVKVVKESLTPRKPLKIRFRGITASPSCLMIRGFLTDDTLNPMRDRLRKNFRNSGLQQSMDIRYPLRAAHATVVRFRTGLANPSGFVQVMEKYRQYDFGTFTANELEFGYNDWYQRERSGKILHVFPLNPGS